MQFAQASTDVCDAGMDVVCDWVLDVTGSERLAELTDWLVERPAKILLLFAVAFVVNRIFRRTIRRGVRRMVADREAKRVLRHQQEVADGRFAQRGTQAELKARQLVVDADRSKQRAQTLGTVLESTATVVIYSLAALIALGELEINLGPLIAGAGIVGIALGFGAQTIVRDFLAGMFMIIEDQFGVGDIVDLGDAVGVVEEISLRTTRIRDVHGAVWYFPNGEVRRVANKSQLWSRSVLDVEVAYDTDIEHAKRVILEAACSVWDDGIDGATILEQPEIWGVERLGDSAVAIRLVVKTEPGEQWMASREIRQRIKVAFDRAGIVIPFPQRVVWHAGESAPFG